MSEKEAFFKALGNKVTEYSGLETFEKPANCSKVTLNSDEVTGLCPKTGQPDWYDVTVSYTPKDKCIESKTFKLLMHSLRNQAMFVETMAAYIFEEVKKYVEPDFLRVEIYQKPRGGVAIVAVAERNFLHEDCLEGMLAAYKTAAKDTSPPSPHDTQL